VIKLRLVVKALNRLPEGTFTDSNWKTTLVDFFNAKHRNEEQLPHDIHQQKTHAVDKWMADEYLSDDEMRWINIIRDEWRSSREELPRRPGFDQFKAQLSSVLHMS